MSLDSPLPPWAPSEKASLPHIVRMVLFGQSQTMGQGHWLVVGGFKSHGDMGSNSIPHLETWLALLGLLCELQHEATIRHT